MAYGIVANVASMTRVYTNAGAYDTTTNPTAAAVTVWLGQFSGYIDVALAQNGFTTPVTEASSLLAITAMVEACAADMCHAANSAGRFFSQRYLESGVSPMMVLRNEINRWATDNAAGMELLGVPRIVNKGRGAFSIAPTRQP